MGGNPACAIDHLQTADFKMVPVSFGVPRFIKMFIKTRPRHWVRKGSQPVAGRGTARQQEIAIRSALGARGR
jgi:hypothetical protein